MNTHKEGFSPLFGLVRKSNGQYEIIVLDSHNDPYEMFVPIKVMSAVLASSRLSDYVREYLLGMTDPMEDGYCSMAQDFSILKQKIHPSPNPSNIVYHTTNKLSSPPLSIYNIEGLVHLPFDAKLCGVYFLCDGNDVIYVGQSKNILQRIASHMGSGRWFDHDRIYFLPTQVRYLDYTEQKYIKKLRPKHNVLHKGR